MQANKQTCSSQYFAHFLGQSIANVIQKLRGLTDLAFVAIHHRLARQDHW